MATGKKIEATLRIAADVAAALAGLKKVRDEAQAAKADLAKSTSSGKSGGSSTSTTGAGTDAATAAADKAAAQARAQAERDAAKAARDAAAATRAAAKEKAAADKAAKVAAQERAAAEKKAAKDVAEAERTAARASTDATEQRRRGYAGLAGQLLTVKNLLLATVGLTIGAGAIRSVVQIADEYAGYSARLRLVTSSQEEYKRSLAEVSALATQYQAPLDATGKLYVKLASAIKPLGGNLSQARDLTEALLASFRATGATAAEAAAGALQFGQALGSGVLAGDEFKSLTEAAPALLTALAEGLKKPRGELKKLGEEGKLTTAAIVPALQAALGTLRGDAAQVSNTIGGSATLVGNSFKQLVGQAAEGSVGVRALTAAMKALADNLGLVVTGLALIASVFVAIKIGVFAQGVATLGVAAVGAAGGVGLLNVALAGAKAILGGPVGLIVFLGSLALAWLSVFNAQKKATTRTEETLRADRDKIQSELNAMRDRVKTTPQVGNATNRKIAQAERDLQTIDSQLDNLRETSRLAGKPKVADNPDLLDSRTVQDFERENRTRASVIKKYADERARYEKAKDLEIAAARRAGDETLANRLLADKRATLQQALKNEANDLKSFDAATTATRVAQVKDLYDQSFDLLRDEVAREAKINEDAFAQGLRDFASYLAARQRLNEEQADDDVADLERRLAQTREVLATNTKRAANPANDANTRETFQEAIVAGTDAVAKLEADIVKRKRDQVDAARELIDLQGKLNRELRDTLADVERQTKQANGTETVGDIQSRVQDAFKGLRERVAQLGGDVGLVDALVGTSTRREVFQKLQTDFGNLTDTLRNQEAALSQAVDQGAITTVQAEQAKFDARARTLPQLQDLAAQLQALATTPAEKNAVAQLVQQLGVLGDKTTEVQATLKASIGNGFATLFTDIATGSERADKAVGKFLGNIAKSMLDLIAKRLGEQLVNSLFGSGGAGGNAGGGWLQALGSWAATLFHSGGVVGSSVSRMTRTVSPHVFAGAQVLHGGGIAGLMPDEQPAILRKGEEVLTANDPRHVNNGGGAGGPLIGNLNVTVSTDGGKSGADPALAQGLATIIKRQIEAGILEAMRPGGILQDAGRR